MELPKELKNDIWDYCRVNDITNIDEFTIKLVKQGFTIEKFGGTPVIKTVDKIVEKIVEVPIDRIVEKIIEVPIAMIDTEISENLKNYIKKYEEAMENVGKLSDQLMLTEKQLTEEKKKHKKDLYGER
jgi:hypothetical protein